MRLALSLIATGLFGCATPYQPHGFRGGYTDFETQPGVYYVRVSTNAATSGGTTVRYWHRRAAEICGGRNRYEILDASENSESHVSGTRSGIVTTSTSHSMSGYIRCAGDGAEP